MRGGRGGPVWPGRPAPGLGRDKAETRRQTSLVSRWLKARSRDTRISNKDAELETVLPSARSGLALHPGERMEGSRGVHAGGMRAQTRLLSGWRGQAGPRPCRWPPAESAPGLKPWPAHYPASPPAIRHLDSANRSQHDILPRRCAKFAGLIGIYDHDYFQPLKTTTQVYVSAM